MCDINILDPKVPFANAICEDRFLQSYMKSVLSKDLMNLTLFGIPTL